MPEKTYQVRLTKKQHRQLEHLTRKGTTNVRTIKRARILLLAHNGLTDAEIMTRVEVSRSTPLNIRRRFQTIGMDVIFEKQRPGRAPKFDGVTRAKITALACTTPPEGFGQWSYRLLADQAVELGYVESIHFDTVGEILKKTSFNRNASEAGASGG
jgi:putative transposase